MRAASSKCRSTCNTYSSLVRTQYCITAGIMCIALGCVRDLAAFECFYQVRVIVLCTIFEDYTDILVA